MRLSTGYLTLIFICLAYLAACSRGGSDTSLNGGPSLGGGNSDNIAFPSGDGRISLDDFTESDGQGPETPGMGAGWVFPYLSPRHWARFQQELNYWLSGNPQVLQGEKNDGSPPKLELIPGDPGLEFIAYLGLGAWSMPFLIRNTGGTAVGIKVTQYPSQPFTLTNFKCEGFICHGTVNFNPQAHDIYDDEIHFESRPQGGLTKTLVLKLHGAGVYRRIVTTPGNGGGPHVRMFRIGLNQETSSKDFFLGDSNSRGGLGGVAQGDVTGDKVPDIIIGSGRGTDAKIFIFDGMLEEQILSVPVFNGGDAGEIRVAVGDFNGDEKNDIAVGSGDGKPARVAIYYGPTFSASEEWEPFRGNVGVYVAMADLNGDGKAEILAGPGKGGGPVLAAAQHNGSRLTSAGAIMVGNPDARDGLSVAVTFLNRSPSPEILLSPGGGTVIIGNLAVNGGQDSVSLAGVQTLRTLRPFQDFNGMIHLGSAFFRNDDLSREILFAAGPGGGPRHQVYDYNSGETLQDEFVYPSTLRGGLFTSGN